MGRSQLASLQARVQGVRAASALMAGLAIYVGAEWLLGSGRAGFPDGHLTPYDLAVNRPFAILSWLSIVSSLYFFYLALIADRPRSARRLIVAVLCYLLLVPGARLGIEYSLKHFTRIDHGQGG
jgi:hypothetical protein